MVVRPVSYLDRFVRRVCVVVPEYRGPKLQYPCGALVLGLLLCECAGRFSQRSKEAWLKKHWHWIKKIWAQGGGQRVTEKGTPSQSTISRLLAMFSEETFARLVYADERRQLWEEWDAYLKKCKVGVISRRGKKEGQEAEATSAILLRRQSSQRLRKPRDRARGDRRDHVLPRDEAGLGQANAR
jgi:hypothetical protein